MNTILLTKPQNLRRWLQIHSLYRSSFPAAERKPFSIIAESYRKGKMDVWCLEKDGDFLGLAITINSDDLILIDYLAVSKKHRGMGVGSASLQALRAQYRGKAVFLEIESVYESCKNKNERLKRKQFYLHCGMTPMNVMVYLFGVKMELLGFDCKINYDTYFSFYRDNLGAWAARHIAPATHPEAN